MSAEKTQPPPRSELQNLLSLYQNKHFNDAEKLALKLTQRFPYDQFAWKVLAIIHKYNGRMSEALALNKKVIEIDPKDTEAHYNLGNTLKELNKFEDAEESYKKAIKLKPDYAEAHNNLAIMLRELGKLEDAKISYQVAIDLKPDHTHAHYDLSQLKKFNKEDEQFIQMKNLYSNHSLSDEKLCYLNFALAKSSEDLDQLANSFKYYSQGNKIRKKLLNYNILEDIKQFDLLKKSNLIIKKNSFKNFNLSDKPSPIFIVGMPRSGTTLVEQIVSSHSNVISGGELLYVSQLGNNIATGKSNVSTQILMNFREKYLEKIRILSNDSPVIIDKMTVNFKYIGLICTAFPDAKIVHVKRNSAATCWGIYKRNFLTEGLRFCYDLNDIVKYYELYKDLMQFWQEEYGNQIYNLNYEMLTIDQKDETKKLIQNLGLEWEEKCLMPQDNKRRVSTASSNQIREKIYQGSSQNWKKFKPFLNGILDHLDD